MLKRILFCVCALALLAVLFGGIFGCASGDLLRIRSSRQLDIPEMPEPTPEHVELTRRLADWTANVLGGVFWQGAPPAAPLVGQAHSAAEAVSVDVGKPAAPLARPAPGVIEASAEVDSALAMHGSARADLNAREAEFQRELTAALAEPVERDWRFGIPILGSVLNLAGIGVAVFGVGFGVMKALGWKKSLLQVFLGVRKFLQSYSANAAISKELKDHFRKAMDPATKKAVTRLYERFGGKR